MKCKFCGKECKNENSLRNHERLCKLNPNKSFTCFSTANPSKINKPWNKGLTKETDIRVAEHARLRSISMKGKVGHPQSIETKEKARQNALKNGLGGFHFRRGLNYKNIKLDSSYEVKVASSLDENNVKWIRPERIRYYDLNNKLHYYTPDFYLPDYDIYLDPKNDFLIENINPNLGYCDKDKIKWVMEQNNIKILILDKNHLTWLSILDLLS